MRTKQAETNTTEISFNLRSGDSSVHNVVGLPAPSMSEDDICVVTITCWASADRWRLWNMRLKKYYWFVTSTVIFTYDVNDIIRVLSAFFYLYLFFAKL